jgi:hypothetical protein
LPHTLYSLLLIFSKVIVWTLWSLGLTTTIARVILRLRVQHRFHAEDYFAIVAFVFFTGLTAVVTTAAPIFEMTRAYLLAAAVNPLTPPPLPLPVHCWHNHRIEVDVCVGYLPQCQLQDSDVLLGKCSYSGRRFGLVSLSTTLLKIHCVVTEA